MKHLLSYKETGFAAIGELCAIQGRPKEGKTTFAAILAAAILKGERNRITCNVPDATVLYIDTECNEATTAQLQKSIFSLCGWSNDQSNTHFSALNLRDTPTPAERRAAIAAAVEAMKPTAVIIDSVQGLAELDEADTTTATRALLEMAVKNECAIFVTMTTATSTGHARGHIASNLENACTDIFSTKKCTWEEKFAATHTGRGEEIKYPIFYSIPSKEDKQLQELLEQVFGSVTTLATATITERLHQVTGKSKSRADHLKGKAVKLGLLQPVEGQAGTYRLTTKD